MNRLHLQTVLFLLFFVVATIGGCATEEDSIPPKRIHLMNPWDDATPQIHGSQIDSWGKAAMTQEEACGWFVYEFQMERLGVFRFLKGDSWTIQYGAGGIGSDADFNVDMLYNESDDVWIDTTQGDPVATATKPQVGGCGSDGVEDVVVPDAGDAAHPFPQVAVYDQGIMPEFAGWTHVQAVYDVWRSEFLASSGDMTRVLFDDHDSSTAAEQAKYSVSEGIGYGMLISAIMDNADNNTRADFDGLWAYYQNFSNANGLMNWKTEEFSDVVEVNGASDGDLDAALALLIAHLQWGDDQYLTDALVLIDAIQDHEINTGGFLKPGDAWDVAKNPSYFSFVAFKYFAHFDSADADFWNNVVDVQYGLLADAANGSTGLVPNWCDESGAAKNPANGYGDYWGHFGFDAVRAPWRAAWDYLWFGDSRGGDFAGKIAAWSEGKTGGEAANIRSVYTLGGDAVAEHNGYTAHAAFTGAFAAACTVNAERQAYLDALYAQLRNQIGEVSYYHTTLQVLYIALISGNMPNYLEL